MKKLKIGLNGFGRIGRAFTRIVSDREGLEVVHVNTRKTSDDMLAYLLKYDSSYRTFNKDVSVVEGGIEVDGRKITTSQQSEPEEIPWGDAQVDIVVDATGAFVTKPDLEKHLHSGVKKVILTAPSKDDATCHVVLGTNEIDWKSETIISNASCTTNGSAPLFKVLHESFGVIKGFLTTAHAYTQSQSLLDDANKKPDRSRSAPNNIIPSTTGAADAVGKVIPELRGKLDGMSIRVPVPTVSFVDVTAVVSQNTTSEEVNKVFQEAAQGPMKGILQYATEVLVSSDYIGSPYSAIFDANYTKVIDGDLVKVFGWYDNEWGYSTRLADLAEKVGHHI